MSVPVPVLTPFDACDRCGVQALVLVVLASGLDLRFCGHHFTKHAEVLDMQSLVVVDKRPVSMLAIAGR